MSFTDFAYFNGSVRRDRAQESVMQTFNAREKFLKKLEEERHMRQVVQRKTNAAVIIQKFYRRNAAKNVIHRQWRQQFDINEASSANNKEILLDRLSRIALFHRHPQDDGRLITICSQTLSFMRTNSIAPVEMMIPRTRLLVLKTVLKFLVKSQKNTNITMPVRFIETFAFLDPESVYRLIKMGYMTAMVSVVVKTSEAMGIGAGADGAFHLEETVPPKLDAILQLLLTPIDKCDKEKRCTVLNSLLSAINENPNQSVAVRVLLAFIRKNIKAKKISFEDVMSAFEFDQNQKLDVSSEQSTSAENIVDRAEAQGKSEKMMDLKLVGQKMAWILTEIMTIGEEDGSLQNSAAKVRLLSVISKVVPIALNSSSDFDDKSMETEEKVTQCWLKESIQKRLTLPIFKSMIFSALQQGDSLSLVVGFERQLSGMIYEISMSEQFIQRLWDSICEVGENSGSGTPMVVFSQFTHVNASGEALAAEHLLGSAIALFCNSIKAVISTIPDSEFSVENTLHFDKNKFLFILRSLREICLNLINLAFPEWCVTSKYTPKPEHESLLNTVVEMLQAVYQKDTRIHFLPEGFWSDHLRQIVISRGSWQAPTHSRFGRNRLPGVGVPQNRSVSGYVYELFRARQRNSSDEDSDEEDDALREANLSVTDKRNLCILRNIPFIVPFSQRIKIFHDLLEFEKQNVPDTGFDEGSARNLTTVSIRRHELYEDAFAQLGDCNKVDLRQKISVRMINMHGIQERGVDGGGIFRDFLTELLKTGLDPSRGFFTYTHDRLLYPNPVAMNIYAAEYWRHFHFLGRMLAKLIRMKMMAEIRFAEFFIAQLLGQSRESCIDLHHMLGYDPELYRHLKNLLHYSEEEIENLQLDFSILVEELGSVRKMDLKPGGSNIPVTIANRQEFVRLYVNYYLFQRIEPMVLAMRDGVSSVLSIEWLAMFSPTELQTLVSGIEGPIDVADMRRNCLVYHIRNEADDAYARMFWEVVEAMSPGDQRLLLKFVTGCSRPPIEGFSQLEPKMGITLVDKDPEALPTSATCMNLLTLPKYSSKARLEEKLRYAINSGAGFELE